MIKAAEGVSLRYPASIEPDGDGFSVDFRDVPEALTGGATLEEARRMAADALALAMQFYLEDHRPVAMPSPALDGEHLIELPAWLSAAVLQLNEDLKNGS